MHASSVLPCQVRLALSEEDFVQVRAVRAAAYGHHDPALAQVYGAPDAVDRDAGSAVLLCRDKASGAGLGTLRIQCAGRGPLAIERSVALPPWLAQAPRAQLARLAVLPGADTVVRLGLMKASYDYCLAMQIRWMVIGARNAALIRGYRSLGFRPVFDDGRWVPLHSAGGLAHQVLALDVAGAEAAWQATRNRLLGFMTGTRHPDLQLAGS